MTRRAAAASEGDLLTTTVVSCAPIPLCMASFLCQLLNKVLGDASSVLAQTNSSARSSRSSCFSVSASERNETIQVSICHRLFSATRALASRFATEKLCRRLQALFEHRQPEANVASQQQAPARSCLWQRSTQHATTQQVPNRCSCLWFTRSVAQTLLKSTPRSRLQTLYCGSHRPDLNVVISVLRISEDESRRLTRRQTGSQPSILPNPTKRFALSRNIYPFVQWCSAHVDAPHPFRVPLVCTGTLWSSISWRALETCGPYAYLSSTSQRGRL